MKLYSAGFLLLAVFIWFGAAAGRASCQPDEPDTTMQEIRPQGLT